MSCHLNWKCTWNVKAMWLTCSLGHHKGLNDRRAYKKEWSLDVWRPLCSLHSNKSKCYGGDWDFWTSHSHALKKNRTEHYLGCFTVLSTILPQQKLIFHLLSLIICTYLAGSTTCRWLNNGQVPALIALWQRDASDPVRDRMWIARCSVHMAKKQGASFQVCCS